MTYQAPQDAQGYTSSIVQDELTTGMAMLRWYDGNSVSFSMTGGVSLANIDGQTVLGRVESGSGNVIVMSDIGMLSAYPDGLLNPQLVLNLTGYTK